METNHTAAIFDALGITPETHSWAYFINNPNPFTSWQSPRSLLDGTLEADGLAVRLVEIAANCVDFIQIFPCDAIRYEEEYVGSWCIDWNADNDCYKIRKSFAHAAHDALVEALGINKEGEKE